jgi:hypothetical protein
MQSRGFGTRRSGGAVTGLLAMTPYLGYVAVAGVALSLAVGAVTSALAVGVLGFVVYLVGDKILRPVLGYVPRTHRAQRRWLVNAVDADARVQ